MCLAPVVRPEGPAPKGQESLAQGLPWVSQNKRFALKGLEMRRPAGSKVGSRCSPYLMAPSGLIRVGELFRVNPGLCFIGHFGHRSQTLSTELYRPLRGEGFITIYE
jgi:hypothetical protein